MEDLFKKFLYTGVGFVALTTEKFQKTIDGLVDDGKISEEEGKKLVGDLVDNTSSKREEFESKLRAVAEEVIAKFTFVSKEEFDALKTRVEELEEKLAVAAESDEKKAAKKATTKTAEN